MEALKSRPRCLLIGMVACAVFTLSDSRAQSYPVKPIRLVVGFTPGGVADAVGRLVAHNLTEPLGQQVIVENRGGASGAIANELVAKSKPDGYTLLVIGATASVLPSLRTSLPYDVERDLAPIGLVASAPFVLTIHPSVPAKGVKDLVSLARAMPGKLSYGSVGAGSPPHLMGGLFNLMAKVNIVHVPYKGGAANATANANGEIEISFLSIPSLLPLFNAGRLKPLAVTSLKRSSSLPTLPTLDESGLAGYDYANWNGVVTTNGVSRDIITRLNTVLVRVIETAEVKEQLKRLGLEAQTSTPAQFATYIQNEVRKNASLIKSLGLAPQ